MALIPILWEIGMKMEFNVITMESSAFKALEEKINALAEYIHNQKAETSDENELTVDSKDAADILRISERTLQRLRTAGEINYYQVKGKYWYTISELRKLIKNRMIKSDIENMEELKELARKKWSRPKK